MRHLVVHMARGVYFCKHCTLEGCVVLVVVENVGRLAIVLQVRTATVIFATKTAVVVLWLVLRVRLTSESAATVQTVLIDHQRQSRIARLTRSAVRSRSRSRFRSPPYSRR